MRKYLLTAITLIFLVKSSVAQTTISFATGVGPVFAAPWVLGGTAATVGSVVQLTAPVGSVTGRIYTSTPITLTGCGSFTAEFDFQQIPSSSAFAIADGMAFWVLSPLSGFGIGGGIGLPTNPNGLVLVLDNYDNDGVANDPLISLYGYPTGFTGTYTEGVTTNRLAALNNQVFVSDGGWHHVKMTYAGGLVKVYFNHNAIPSMTGTFPIASPNLYFGFCGATGGAWSTQSVKNCVITFDNISPISGPSVLCNTGTSYMYTDSTAGGVWSSSAPSIVSIDPTTGDALALTPGTTTIAYTYSGTCIATKVVTVSATVLPAISGPTPICTGATAAYSNTATGGTWSCSSPTLASIDASTGVLTGLSAGGFFITYTLPSGCYQVSGVSTITGPPFINITPSPASVCNNGSLTLTAAAATTYNLITPQGWEYGVPSTPGVPVESWTYNGFPAYWYQMDGTFAATPAIGAAHSGTYVANFNCRSLPAGSGAGLNSPNFSMVGVTSATFSIWVYRDVSAFNTGAYDTEGITIYLGAGSISILMGYIPRRGGAPITGAITGVSTPGTSGWYQYTYTIPTSVTGPTNYIYIYATSRNGNNIYIDDVSVTATIGPPTWSPSTWLYNDAGLTTPYSGAPMNPVYMHPTGITTPTNITYTASLTSGTCTSTGTRTVTMNPNPDPITGTTVICIGSTVPLSSTTAGGSWSSSNGAAVSIGSSSGIMLGLGTGTSTINYCFGGCCVSTVVTVVASPGAITGISIACLGSTTALSNSVAGGTWSSSTPGVGTVDPTTGIVRGMSLGTTIITYGIATCYSTFIVTVNPYPAAITGSMGVCVGATTTLTSSPSGGFWFSGIPPIASVVLLTGVVTGVNPGASTISYRLNGCQVTATVNVVSTPGPITGVLTTCAGSTTLLTHAVAGGAWSSSDVTKATVGASTGLVTGEAAGTARITYTVGTGCFATAVVTVTAAPPAPTGTLTICAGGSTTLTHGTFGGTWSCGCPGIATVGIATGVVTSVAAGTCIVTYHLPSGCLAMATVTINPLTAPITGTLSICEGGTTTLSTATPSVSWGSSNPSVAVIDASGVVTGLTAGTATMTCPAIGGCPATAVVTVNPLPTPITGTTSVCETQSTTLSSGPGIGVWTSCAGIGTISGTGVFTGLTSGTCIVSFTTPASCSRSTVINVNPNPAPLVGAAAMCISSCITLTTTSTGGIWSSSDPSVLPILGPGGFACGASSGTATISYTVGTGCSATRVATVSALPGTITGILSICQGQTTTLVSSPAGGGWVSGTPSTGTIDAVTGTFTGLAPGTSTITYSLGTGCTTTVVVTVNSLPGPIGGTINICSGISTTLTSTPGPAFWSGGCAGILSITAGGTITGIGPGTCMVTAISLTTACQRTAIVTVNATPAVITGPTNVCIGQTASLASTTTGGNWTSSNGNVTVNPSTGLITGVFSGTSVVSYTMPGTGGCYRTTVILVNPLPGGISGSLQVCEGSATTLTGAPTGGTWSSSCMPTGSITSGSGVYSGLAAGTCTVVYTLPTSCSLATTMTVNALPGSITGIPSTCVGQTTTLNSTPAGGTWSTGSGNATVHPTSGVVTGSNAGTASITYTSLNGCRRATTVTVFALPGIITGATQVCIASTTTLNCLPAGGAWTTGCGFASINVTTGVVTGISDGTCNVTYTAGAGCSRTTTITVNPLPAPIGGTMTTCSGNCVTVTDATPSGTWTSSPSGIVAGSGLICPAVPGTIAVTYTLPTTCRATATMTVYALPGAITSAGGTLNACEGQCTGFSTLSPGGTWISSNPATGTINSGTGMFCGIANGTTSLTYTLGTGCISTATVTVNPVPLPVTGTLSTCIGQCTSLFNATGTGTWSSASPAIGTITSGGSFCGVSAGTSLVSYTLGTGCASTALVTVNPLPTIITGPTEVCEQSDINLASTPTGGVWSSGTPLLGTINASSGVFSGLSAGTALISYTAGMSCVRTANVTVNPQPGVITGNLGVCIGFSTSLSTSSTGGTWYSSNPGVATISSSGVVTSVTTGTTLISYTLPVTGCTRAVVVTVNGLPAPITGSDGFCNLSSTMYSSATSGGTWSSANPLILTIDPLTGVATGVLVDTTDIIYTLPTTCSVTKRVFLILAPYPITGPNDVCLGNCTALTNVIGGGVWSSSNPGVAPVSGTGLVCGLSLGTTSITYVLSTGCSSTHDVTVNPIPVGIIGTLQVCEGLSTILTNSTPGGTWHSSSAIIICNPTTGMITGVSAGTAVVTYALSSGCNATVIMTVNPLPGVITGNDQVCEGSTTVLGTASTGGVWVSHDPGVAFIDAATGLMTGMSAMTPGIGGTGITTITYTLPTACMRTQSVTVNPLPTPITGVMNVCVDDMTVLHNATPGGGWISSNIAVGTIDGVTGIFTGISAGTTIISYLLPTGCVATWPMQVHANPLPIGGSLSVCAGFTTNLTSGPAGGTWSQPPSTTGYGTIHSLTGVVSGIVAGVIPVTYTMGSGCRAVNEVTVITLPPVISGPTKVCVDDSVVLSNFVSGGVWSSSNPAKATVNGVTGMVHGISAGTTVVTYTVGTGCFNILHMTVNPLPLPVTGPLQVCEGSTILLSSGPTPGGNWVSDTTSTATVGYNTGIVTGINDGVANISYILGATGCLRAAQVTVNLTPDPIMGNANVCIGSTGVFTNSTLGGSWHSSNPAIATIGLTTGLVTSVTTGLVTISYVMPGTLCMATRQITVQPLPNVYNVTGGGNYCAGGLGLSIGLSGSQPGVSYVLYNGATATGYRSGTGFALDFDLHTAAGMYTVQATNVTTGCVRNMSGSATVVVTPLVTPSVSIALAPYDSVCPGQPVTLSPITVTGGTAPTYIWKVNGVSVSTAISYNYIPANGDTVSVAMHSNLNCVATPTANASKTLTVLPNVMPEAGVLTSPNDSVCQYNPATFTAAPTYGGASPTYTWFVNGSLKGSGASYTYIPKDGDVVTMTMISDYRCRLATSVTSGEVNISVDSLLIPRVSVYAEPGLAVSTGKPVTLHTSVTDAGANPKYQWKVNGHAVPGATLTSYTAIFNDYDSIVCEIISGGVCANIGTSDWVRISMIPQGVQTSAAISDVRLVPNPNKGVFTLKGTFGNSIDGNVGVDVTDMLGQVVYRGVLTAKQGKLDTQVQLDNTLANGMYILTLRGDGEQKVFHFVLQQ